MLCTSCWKFSSIDPKLSEKSLKSFSLRFFLHYTSPELHLKNGGQRASIVCMIVKTILTETDYPSSSDSQLENTKNSVIFQRNKKKKLRVKYGRSTVRFDFATARFTDRAKSERKKTFRTISRVLVFCLTTYTKRNREKKNSRKNTFFLKIVIYMSLYKFYPCQSFLLNFATATTCNSSKKVKAMYFKTNWLNKKLCTSTNAMSVLINYAHVICRYLE